MISIIIPAYHEDRDVLAKCWDSVMHSIIIAGRDAEIITVLDVKGIGKARNQGARDAKGSILVFLDADCTVSENFINDIWNMAYNCSNFGGGCKWIKPTHYSIGVIAFAISMAIFEIRNRVTMGSFWVKRAVFDSLGGFNEDDDIHLDYDFSTRLKKLAEQCGGNFRSLKRCVLTWSTRSFYKYGDWFWIKHYRVFQV